MFKSVVSGLIAASVLFTPVAIEARDHGDRRDRRGSHIDTGEAVAIGLGALILGAALGSSSTDDYRYRYETPRYRSESRYERPRYRYYRHRGRDAYYRPDRNCYETVVTEYDYYGNRYRRVETRCF